MSSEARHFVGEAVNPSPAGFDLGAGAAVVAALAAVAAVVVSLVHFQRKRPVEAQTLDLQQRDSDRAEQQRREEMRRMEMANIQVSLRQEPGRPSRSGRPWTNNYLDIVNNGPAFAHNVVLGTFEPKQAGADRPGVVRDAFPVRELGPGETVSCPLQIWGDAFEAEVFWDDPRGPQRRIFTVTRG
jgi:hypothetical protein